MAHRTLVPLSIIISADEDGRRTIVTARAWLRCLPANSELWLVCPRLTDKNNAMLSTFADNHESIRLVRYGDTPSETVRLDRAGRKAKGETVLFIRHGIVPDKTSARLVRHMQDYAQRNGSGAVGGLVLGKTGRIRHAGLFTLPDQPYYFLYHELPYRKAVRYQNTTTFPYDVRKSRPIRAVEQVLAINRRTWLSVDGFNASGVSDAQQFVACCSRLREKKLTNWYVGAGNFLDQRTEPYANIPRLPNEPVDSTDTYSDKAGRTNIPGRPGLHGIRRLLAGWHR